MHKYLKLKAKNATQVRNGQDTGGSSEPTATSDGSKIQSVCKKKKRKSQFVCNNKKDESKCSPVTHHIKDGGYVVQ